MIVSVIVAASMAGLAGAQPSAPIPYSAAPATLPNPSGDAQNVLAALAAAKSGDAGRIRVAMAQIYDPTARQIAQWALIDGAPMQATFAEADAARRDLAGWPHEARRQEAAETLMPGSSLPPQAVVAWFAGQTPRTGQGALALARALNATGQSAAAVSLIHTAWRTQPFEPATQDAMIAVFGASLTLDDYVAREDMLLYGAHDAAALDLLRYLPADQQALAQARMALHRGDSGAQAMIAALPMTAQNAPGLIYERGSSSATPAWTFRPAS
jgi:soluble lytic murein transglycosylase